MPSHISCYDLAAATNKQSVSKKRHEFLPMNQQPVLWLLCRLDRWQGCALFLASALFCAAQTAGTALVRHAPTLNGNIDGSVQQMLGEAVTLNGGAAVTGDLLVPGTPTVRSTATPPMPAPSTESEVPRLQITKSLSTAILPSAMLSVVPMPWRGQPSTRRRNRPARAA